MSGEIRIPDDAEAVAEIAAEGEDEQGTTEEQREALAELQARVMRDL